MDVDLQIRLAAFGWLSEQVNLHGDVLPRRLLERGFDFNNQRVPVIAPQGIFKPHLLDLPISITTAPKGPYDDYFGADNFLIYKYRGSDPNHRDNIGLRKMFERKFPLVYFHGIEPGKYLAVWPVYIVGDDPANLTFKVAVDDISPIEVTADISRRIEDNSYARRSYLTSLVKVRLHQRSFRERVLDAYRSQCAFCRLRHRELLDAAHIIPDNLPESRPVITNGIALCKLHHAAFDSFLLGVTPDYTIRVREDILNEEDGPILQYGFKELHTARLILPSYQGNWPDKESLEWRYQKFLQAV
ncbi:MAG: HNH endonuclease [Chloroflexota bacterium]